MTSMTQAVDLFDATDNLHGFVRVSSCLKACAVNLSKMCNDLRILASGPKAGFGELEKNKQEAENSEIVDIVRGMSISLEELPLVLQRLRDGTSGQSVQKSGDGGKEEN